MEKTVKVMLKDGLDAGAIALLVQAACKYESRIYLGCEERRVNAKSIMGMMNMVVTSGTDVIVIAEGSDEAEAVAEIERLLTE